MIKKNEIGTLSVEREKKKDKESQDASKLALLDPSLPMSNSHTREQGDGKKVILMQIRYSSGPCPPPSFLFPQLYDSTLSPWTSTASPSREAHFDAGDGEAGTGDTPLPVMAPLRISLMEDSRVSIRVDIVVTEEAEARDEGAEVSSGRAREGGMRGRGRKRGTNFDH